MIKSNTNDLTEQLVEKLNIKSDMRVLDVGCGTGGVSVILHNYVGNNGEIIAVDNDKTVLEAARSNINQQNIKFLHADINNLPEDIGLFDVIIGRKILMYQDDMNIIDKLKSHLKKKGKIAFQEDDYNIPHTQQNFPVHLEFLDYYIESLIKDGVNTSMGCQLYRIFHKYDLKIEYVNSQLQLESKETESSLEWYFDNISQNLIKYEIIDDSLNLEQMRNNLKIEMETSDTMFIKNMEYVIIGRKK